MALLLVIFRIAVVLFVFIYIEFSVILFWFFVVEFVIVSMSILLRLYKLMMSLLVLIIVLFDWAINFVMLLISLLKINEFDVFVEYLLNTLCCFVILFVIVFVLVAFFSLVVSKIMGDGVGFLLFCNNEIVLLFIFVVFLLVIKVKFKFWILIV